MKCSCFEILRFISVMAIPRPCRWRKTKSILPFVSASSCFEPKSPLPTPSIPAQCRGSIIPFFASAETLCPALFQNSRFSFVQFQNLGLHRPQVLSHRGNAPGLRQPADGLKLGIPAGGLRSGPGPRHFVPQAGKLGHQRSLGSVIRRRRRRCFRRFRKFLFRVRHALQDVPAEGSNIVQQVQRRRFRCRGVSRSNKFVVERGSGFAPQFEAPPRIPHKGFQVGMAVGESKKWWRW
mmetsp:Transcript_16963/g.46588  ORF Transcript_16963/g.46588 Transcript_16963/m.46588 type:complete len:236 (-) Transcript_16963:1292-1999(-)